MATAEEIAAELAGLAASAPERVHREVIKFGALLQSEVMRNASTSPGPNAITGDYRRSISRQTTKSAAGSRCEISTTKPQGPRLEFGFVGTDSLGRTYDQAPRPHFGPAFDKISPEFERALAEVVGEA